MWPFDWLTWLFDCLTVTVWQLIDWIWLLICLTVNYRLSDCGSLNETFWLSYYDCDCLTDWLSVIVLLLTVTVLLTDCEYLTAWLWLFDCWLWSFNCLTVTFYLSDCYCLTVDYGHLTDWLLIVAAWQSLSDSLTVWQTEYDCLTVTIRLSDSLNVTVWLRSSTVSNNTNKPNNTKEPGRRHGWSACWSLSS
jgi:hypothetical protein